MNVAVDSFRKLSGSGNTLGYADVTIDGAIKIRDIRLMSGSNGMFAAMPSRKDKDGKYVEIVHINLAQLKDKLTEELIGEYSRDEIPYEWR